MNSIFLLNSGGEAAQNQSIIEAHFNLWMGDEERFLDIGLKLEAGRELELYLPWKDAQIEDLYNKVAHDDVLNAIFNQHLNVTTSTSAQWKNVTCGTEVFDVMMADLSVTDFQLTNTANNRTFTKLTIKRAHATPHVAYVRLRAKGFAENVFDKEHTATGAFLNPYRETTRAIDFRINEIRTVQPSCFGKGAFTTPEIMKLHFFLLKSFHVTNLLSSPPYYRCRELEDKAWDKYLPSSNNRDDAILAYHWKRQDKEKIGSGQHFSVLATFGEKKASWWIILLYVVIIILLNCSSSFLYDMVTHNAVPTNSKDQSSLSKVVK
jgi:hypothetical protein